MKPYLVKLAQTSEQVEVGLMAQPIASETVEGSYPVRSSHSTATAPPDNHLPESTLLAIAPETVEGVALTLTK
jgi:hypothetical protein